MRALDKLEEVGVGVSYETEVINKVVNTDKQGEEGGEDWNGEVGEGGLKGPNEVGDV